MTSIHWRRWAFAVAITMTLCGAHGALGGEPSRSWQGMDPLVLGDGDEEVVVFTAPSCPYCRRLIDYLPTMAERYRVVVLPISFTSHDAQRIRAMACARDQDAADRAFLLHQDIVLPQKDSCDLSAVKARYAEAKARKVNAVPFIIRPDGEVSRGLRPDLDQWLARGRGS